MPAYYADSSVLVKRHLPELGSQWVLALTEPSAQHQITTARLSLVEAISAFNRRVREGSLAAADYPGVRDDFLTRCRQVYHLVPITNALLNRTRALLERHPLRAYDALHLASALIANDQALEAELPALIFLAADNRLLAAAQAEGLSTDNPNNYP